MKLKHTVLSQMLETAVVAARLGGQHAAEKMNYSKISIKNGNEIVTETDSQSQQIIIDRIKQNYSDHGFIGEEGSEGNIFKQAPRTSESFWWIIDPIDGTNNFASGIPVFTVSIALLYEGKPIVGVVFDPIADSMFTATSDSQAQLNGRNISVNEKTIDRFTEIGLDNHFDKGIPEWAETIMTETRFRNFGTTALHLAYVASGGFAANVINTPKLWDIAAGGLLVESAGGVFSDWQGKPIFPVNPEDYKGEQIASLAGNKKLHPKLIEMINKSG
jgi:myo-inositol-1(or 4)-monophosphatase